MADVDYIHCQNVLMNAINNPVAAHTIGVSPFQLTFKRFALVRIFLKPIQDACDTFVNLRFPVRHVFKHTRGLI